MAAVLAFRPQGRPGAGREMALVDRTAPGLRPLWIERIPGQWWALAPILLTLPAWANGFWLFQVMGWTFILGIIALSLMFLAGYGGMVSLIQMSVAALAGDRAAIFAAWDVSTISMGLPSRVVIAVAIAVATSVGTVVGVLAVRTERICTSMITLSDVALSIAATVTMMHNGRVFKEGTPGAIENDRKVQELYLGDGGHAHG